MLTASMLAGCGSSSAEESTAASSETKQETAKAAPETTAKEEGENEKEQDVSEKTETQADSNYPVTIENNGSEYTYEAAPEKVIVLSYVEAEVLSALGVADRIIALAPGDFSYEQVKDEYKGALENAPEFTEDMLSDIALPTLEGILSLEPDFVFGSYLNFFEDSCGSVEDYAANGINIYAADGTCVDAPTFEDVYTEIRNLGLIFDVSDKAEEIISDMRSREQAVEEAVADASVVEVFNYDTYMGEGAFLTSGGTTIEDYMINNAGGHSMFDDAGRQFAMVTAEEIIDRDPDCIVVTEYSFDGDIDEKIDLVRASEDFAGIKAVVNDAITPVPGTGVWPGMQTIDAYEIIAKALHPEAF